MPSITQVSSLHDGVIDEIKILATSNHLKMIVSKYDKAIIYLYGKKKYIRKTWFGREKVYYRTEAIIEMYLLDKTIYLRCRSQDYDAYALKFLLSIESKYPLLNTHLDRKGYAIFDETK